MLKSLLILSGGLDSTVSSALAVQETTPLLALTFDYGQRAAQREIESASKIASHLKVPHKVIRLPWLAEITSTALVSHQERIPHVSEEELNVQEKGLERARLVWVPNRNGLFLNIAACFAETLEADLLVTGFNREEGETFPDNSASFIEASNHFFKFSTLQKPQVISYTIAWDKVRIAEEAKKMALPFKDLWFCYEGDSLPCRQCESCLRDFRAFHLAGIEDPWKKR